MTATTVTTASVDPPKRAFCSHQPKWQRYQASLLQPETKNASQKDQETYQYHRQYSHVYAQRLQVLRNRCWKQFDTSGSDEYTRIYRVLELREDVPSQIVGTLVKETTDPSETPLYGTCRPSDQLFLEDESGRVALALVGVHQYCTGVVVGVQGKVDKVGVFHVERLVVPAPPPQPVLEPVLHRSTNDKAPHLLLVSSLLCGDPNIPSLPRELLISYLQGQFTDDACKVCRVVICGGGPSAHDPLFGTKELDAFLVQLTKAGIPVDILPGKNDPTTANWPQRPLHSSLLPHATALVNRTPNPSAAAHGGKLMVATDGANIQDLQQHILQDEENTPLSTLDALQRTLEWSHLCPTGPDSVPTVPHLEQDPMVLEELPHLLVCGNATEFATRTTPTTTMVCVPQFSTTGEAVLVNMETLDVELLRFEEEQEDNDDE